MSVGTNKSLSGAVTAATAQLSARQSLSRAEARAVMEELLSGVIPDEEIIAFLVELRDKGETADELIGFAGVMREHAAALLERAGVCAAALAATGHLLDTCGTGGDGLGTFNVSTAAAFVAAAAGVRVAKHGNRSISSQCGSADVLEALGVVIDLPLERIPECLEAAGIVFLYAPHLHPAMKHVMNARRTLRTKTAFNLLGPLTNPLGATVQLVGVYDRRYTEKMACALAAFGTRRAFVVSGWDGIDEISTSGATQLSEVSEAGVATRTIVPEDFGLARTALHSLSGGDARTNARLLVSVLEGKPGPYRDVVVANASAALVAAGRASDFLEGSQAAAEMIDSGRARAGLSALVEFTQKHAL